jgi:hypothetical protein
MKDAAYYAAIYSVEGDADELIGDLRRSARSDSQSRRRRVCLCAVRMLR